MKLLSSSQKKMKMKEEEESIKIAMIGKPNVGKVITYK